MSPWQPWAPGDAAAPEGRPGQCPAEASGKSRINLLSAIGSLEPCASGSARR